jgi:hypothetical protein
MFAKVIIIGFLCQSMMSMICLEAMKTPSCAISFTENTHVNVHSTAVAQTIASYLEVTAKNAQNNVVGVAWWPLGMRERENSIYINPIAATAQERKSSFVALFHYLIGHRTLCNKSKFYIFVNAEDITMTSDLKLNNLCFASPYADHRPVITGTLLVGHNNKTVRFEPARHCAKMRHL